MEQSSGKPKLLKEINRSLVFNIVKNARSVSRPQLARKTGLSRATIAVLADELLETGLVQEIGLDNSTGGRPPVLLEFRPDAALAIGACLQEYDWLLVLTDLDARIQRRAKVHIPDSTPAAAVASLATGIHQLLCDVDREKVLPAVGLGTPGLVDIHSGIIKLAADRNWRDIPFKDMVEDKLGRRCFMANRSKVGALAEFWHGARKGVKNLIYVSVGTGVAAGIILQGKLYVGSNSSAGELGHLTIEPDGPICPCGNRGCLQQLVSEEAITALARERLRRDSTSVLQEVAGHHPELITVQDVFRAAELKDQVALDTLEVVAEYLAIALAGFINLFNPEIILLGGPVGQASDVLVELIREKVRHRAMAYPLSVVQIVKSSLGIEAGAIGASVLVLQQANKIFFQMRQNVLARD